MSKSSSNDSHFGMLMVAIRVCLALCVFPASAVVASAQGAVFPVHATVAIKDGEGAVAPREIWILSATGTSIRYLESADGSEAREAPMADLLACGFPEPSDYSRAIDLYQARKYSEARIEFEKIKVQCQPLIALKNSPGVMAAFFEMECMRNMNDIEALSKALREFRKESLIHEVHQRQLELYVLWESLQANNRERIESLVAEFKKTRLPGCQLAQVEYCLGRAREQSGKTDEAIAAYQMAMIADAGASEVVTRESALRVLEILHGDPDLQAAVKLRESGKAKGVGPGHAKLLEAMGLARLYEGSLGAGSPLPAKFKYLLGD